jgi:small subunit ribosomal protein S16
VAVRIRLTRVGATKRPAYRVIAIDGRRPRDGRALEILGFYDPLTEPATVQLQTERIAAWIGKGAQPSDTVVRLMRQAENASTPAAAAAEAPKKRPARAKAAPKAAAAAAPADATAAASDDADGSAASATPGAAPSAPSAETAAQGDARPDADGEASA